MKNLYIVIFLLISVVHADFLATTTRQVSIKDTKITAKIDDEQAKQIIGAVKFIDISDGRKQAKITWTTVVEKGKKISVNFTSEVDLNSSTIARGVSILVKGSLSDGKFDIEEEKKDKEDKNTTPYFSSTQPSTSTTTVSLPSTGTVSSGIKDTIGVGSTDSNVSPILPPLQYTYDTCNHIYNASSQTIDVYQQSFYIDKNNNKQIKDNCHKIKTVPAILTECDQLIDWNVNTVYDRKQPQFTDSETKDTYSAGGCIPTKSYLLSVDLSANTGCVSILAGTSYIQQGKWYYVSTTGEKVYLSGCILDPLKQANNLLIQFDGCPISHDVKNNQSDYFGRYYYINSNGKKEYLGECQETNSSRYTHQIRWNDGEFEHDIANNKSRRVMTRLIVITSENNREVIIDDKELETANIPIYLAHKFKGSLNLPADIVWNDSNQTAQRKQWRYITYANTDYNIQLENPSVYNTTEKFIYKSTNGYNADTIKYGMFPFTQSWADDDTNFRTNFVNKYYVIINNQVYQSNATYNFNVNYRLNRHGSVYSYKGSDDYYDVDIYNRASGSWLYKGVSGFYSLCGNRGGLPAPYNQCGNHYTVIGITFDDSNVDWLGNNFNVGLIPAFIPNP